MEEPKYIFKKSDVSSSCSNEELEKLLSSILDECDTRLRIVYNRGDGDWNVPGVVKGPGVYTLDLEDYAIKKCKISDGAGGTREILVLSCCCRVFYTNQEGCFDVYDGDDEENIDFLVECIDSIEEISWSEYEEVAEAFEKYIPKHLTNPHIPYISKMLGAYDVDSLVYDDSLVEQLNQLAREQEANAKYIRIRTDDGMEYVGYMTGAHEDYCEEMEGTVFILNGDFYAIENGEHMLIRSWFRQSGIRVYGCSITEIEEISKDAFDEVADSMRDDAGVKNAAVRKWVGVADNLPANDHEVIVQTVNGDILKGFYNKDRKEWFGILSWENDYFKIDVARWMNI